jgi:hypothetical protein
MLERLYWVRVCCCLPLREHRGCCGVSSSDEIGGRVLFSDSSDEVGGRVLFSDSSDEVGGRVLFSDSGSSWLSFHYCMKVYCFHLL